MTLYDATVGKALDTPRRLSFAYLWVGCTSVSAQSQLISLITQCQRRINFTDGKR